MNCKGIARIFIERQRRGKAPNSEGIELHYVALIFLSRSETMDEKENPLLQYDDYPAASGFHIVSGAEDDEYVREEDD